MERRWRATSSAPLLGQWVNDLVALDSDPHRLIGQRVGHRVGHAAIADGGRPRHLAGLAEHGGVGPLGEAVQALAFLDEQLSGWAPGGPVLPGVDARHELLARGGELHPARVLLQQVGVGGHQVGLGQPHCRFRPTLGLWVGGHAGGHGDAVMTSDGHHLGVAHGDAGHVVHGHGALVVGEPVGRCAPEGPVERSRQAMRVGMVRSQAGMTTR